MSKTHLLKNAVHSTLVSVFHKSSFRPGQEKAILTLLKKHDLLCIFPTGAGKSICFQLPAMLFSGLTLIISPLIALMNDQVRHLKEHGIPADCINSLQSPEERRKILSDASSGKIKLLYISPERLQQPNFIAEIVCCDISMLVVDEAHCIVQWGEDFRPSYNKISDFVKLLPHRPVICAMTATADKQMQREIVTSLSMRIPKIQALPLLRENLIYSIVMTMGKNHEIAKIIAAHPMEKGVIFCRTRRRTEELAEFLSKRQFSPQKVQFYHAGMDRDERHHVQELFTSGECSVLTTTSAFGMGVDIPDIRYVIHDSFPEDMIDYVQQSGRAGRDGKQSECIVLFDVADVEKMRHSLQRMRNSKDTGKLQRIIDCRKTWSKERQSLEWIMSGECLSAGLLKVFSQNGKPCGKCSVCVQKSSKQQPDEFHEVPDLSFLNREQLCYWALRWQRSRLAKSINASPSSIISSERMKLLSRGLLLNENDNVSEAVMKKMNFIVIHMKNA